MLPITEQTNLRKLVSARASASSPAWPRRGDRAPASQLAGLAGCREVAERRLKRRKENVPGQAEAFLATAEHIV